MSQVPGLQFGTGYLLASPQTNEGQPAPNPTPLQIGVIQSIKFTLGADIKMLFGQQQWSVDSAVGKRSISGSFEFAQISNILLSQLFTGDTVAAGVTETSINEAHMVPASTAYTITITPPGSGVFVADFGVTYALTGLPFTKVATGPTVGEYSVNVSTGVYAFAAADASAAVLITYTYTNTTQGTTLAAANHVMGYGPIVQINAVFQYEGGGIGFLFPNVRLGKVDIATKLDDYATYSTDFQAFAGAAGIPFISYQAF